MNNKVIVLKNNFIKKYLILNELNSITVLKYFFYYRVEVLFIIYYCMVDKFSENLFLEREGGKFM